VAHLLPHQKPGRAWYSWPASSTHRPGPALTTVRLFLRDNLLVIMVWDDETPELPVLRRAGRGELGGRGLMMVEALNEAWASLKISMAAK
jgi:hypothetical protein